MASSSPAMLTPELTPCQSVASSPSLPPTPDPRPLDLVIANYNECLTWLSTYSSLATVYSKGKLPPDLSIFREVKALPNWGRESHTYLHHIVHNYDNLADVTLFLQGNIHDTNDGTPAHTDLTLDEIVGMAKRLTDLPDILSESVLAQNQPQGGVLPLGKIHSFVDWDGVRYLPGWIDRRGKGLRRSQYSPGQFWNYIFNGTTDKTDPRWVGPPAEIRWTQGALFAVTRQTIQRLPRAVYERAYSYFHSLADVNPEEGHYMERFWLSLFSHQGVDRQQDGLYVPHPMKALTEEASTLTAEEHGADVEDEGIFMW